MHTEPHRLRGQTVPLLIGTDLVNYRIEDWADVVFPAAEDSTLVYGHILDGEKTGGLARLVEDDWLEPPTEDEIIDQWVGASDD